MTTALITAIGGDIAQGVAAIVREHFPDWRILGTDIHSRHGGQLFVDRVDLAPPASDRAYGEWLAAHLQSQRVDICVPMSEVELSFVAGKPELRALARFAMPSARAIEVGNDKLLTARFLESIGCAAPWTLPAEELTADVSLPCIFKPRRGAGSKGVFICKSLEEVRFYRERYPDSILQELLLPADKEVTCSVFRSRGGDTVVLQLLRTLVGGFTGWAEVIDVLEVTQQCTRIADALDLHGPINVQLRLTNDGPRIFEINSRFSSTVLMRHRMGFCDVVWTLQDLLQQPVSLFRPAVGTNAVRVQGAAILKARLEDEVE
jgi:carbamoyl-phosphate synthase large subunit